MYEDKKLREKTRDEQNPLLLAYMLRLSFERKTKVFVRVSLTI